MTPRRVQLRRSKGWRMPANTVKIDRTTHWGNPFVIGQDGTREECIALYRRFVAGHAAHETPGRAGLAAVRHGARP